MEQVECIRTEYLSVSLRVLIRACDAYDEKLQKHLEDVSHLSEHQKPLDAAFWRKKMPQPFLGKERRTEIANLLDRFENALKEQNGSDDKTKKLASEVRALYEEIHGAQIPQVEVSSSPPR